MRRALPLLLLLPCLLGATRVLTGAPFTATGPGGAPLRARVLFTSNHIGEFEPCSCPDLPLGGLAQEVGLVETLRAETPAPTFLFDAGDRLFQHDLAAISQEEAARRARAIALVDAGGVAGIDAVGVGGLDLGAGLDYLRKLASRAAYPTLSANLVDPDGALVFAPSLLIERDGVRIGVTSVLPGGMRLDDCATTDPYTAARSATRELRGRGAELVVVLSNLGLKADRALARRAGADLVLGSRSREVLVEAERAGSALLAQAGSRGRYLGDVRWYGEPGARGRGRALVGTATPVLADGPVSGPAAAVVAGLLLRLADPTLGVVPIQPGAPEHPGQPPAEEPP